MNTFSLTLKKIEQAAFASADMGTIYVIQQGDTLSQIISDHYGIGINDPLYNLAEASAIYFNRKIEDRDRIRAGDPIRLMTLPSL